MRRAEFRRSGVQTPPPAGREKRRNAESPFVTIASLLARRRVDYAMSSRFLGDCVIGGEAGQLRSSTPAPRAACEASQLRSQAFEKRAFGPARRLHIRNNRYWRRFPRGR